MTRFCREGGVQKDLRPPPPAPGPPTKEKRREGGEHYWVFLGGVRLVDSKIEDFADVDSWLRSLHLNEQVQIRKVAHSF